MFFHQPGKQQDPLRTSDAQETKAFSVFDLVFVTFLETASLFVLSGLQGVDAGWHADPRVINKIPIFFCLFVKNQAQSENEVILIIKNKPLLENLS